MKKVLRTALIGLGKIAQGYTSQAIMAKIKYPTHLSALIAHPGYRLVAGADIDRDARKQMGNKTRIRTYSDWELMLRNEGIDLLVIATPTTTHVGICNRAIDLGIKRIFCEKPIAYSSGEAKKLILKAHRNDVFLTFNYFRAFNPSYRHFLDKLRRGHFGQLVSFSGSYCKGIYNNGTHLFEILVRLLGEVDWVEGYTVKKIGLEIPDPTISALVKFKNNTIGFINGVSEKNFRIFEYVLFFEKAKVIVSSDKVVVFKQSVLQDSREKVLEGYTNQELSIDTKLGLYPAYHEIYNHLINKRGLSLFPENAFYVLHLAESCVKSVKIKERVKV